ncbi:MAG: hypothetical protein ACRCTU_00080, partial [Zoogloea sp.]|uniref:hypothetical protein n=1 Tax=Zoogloea sp. TaxID=49181 RepID=UPI003F3B5221
QVCQPGSHEDPTRGLHPKALKALSTAGPSFPNPAVIFSSASPFQTSNPKCYTDTVRSASSHALGHTIRTPKKRHTKHVKASQKPRKTIKNIALKHHFYHQDTHQYIEIMLFVINSHQKSYNRQASIFMASVKYSTKTG